MNAKTVERRLAAVLAADMVGYSRLMEADEEGTLAALKRCLGETVHPKVAEHGGRVVKSTGDGLLVEYPSVLQAVRSAIAIQRDLAASNAQTPAETRTAFRIGINLGDIILEDGDIFGDGVNVASRIEALAPPGGIAVSASVYAQVRNRLDVAFTDLGRRRVKNIAEPIQVYGIDVGPRAGRGMRRAAGLARLATGRNVALAGVVVVAAAAALLWPAIERRLGFAPDTASQANLSFPLPQEPSIAVLPFADLGDASHGAALGDSITDNVIAALSKVPGLFVIARESSVVYRQDRDDAARAAEELGVRYVLEGSVQASDDRVRTTSRLVDALSGQLLWSERYDHELADVFALQDDIALNVVTALQIELTEGELARVRQRGTDNLEAWLLVTQSLDAYMRFTRQDNQRARALAQRAAALDASYAEAYIRIARCDLTDFQTGWAANREAALLSSVEHVQHALALAPDYPDAYVILGAIHLFLRNHDEAIAYAEKAVSLSPSHSLAKASLAMILNYAGEPERAVEAVRAAMRLSPHYPDWFAGELGRGYLLLGRYDDAIAALRERLKRNPQSGEGQILLAAAYAAAGRQGEARQALSAFLTPRPDYTLAKYAAGEFYRDDRDLAAVVEALRKAGMPEE